MRYCVSNPLRDQWLEGWTPLGRLTGAERAGVQTDGPTRPCPSEHHRRPHTEEQGIPSRRSRTVKKIALGTGAALALGLIGWGAVWALTCPCEGTPGFVLLGDRHDEPVSDWSFANDVALCQIQISMGLRPHSVNLNCMASPDGELFLSCSVGARKYWCPRVGPDEGARLRLDGVVYPVVLNRVTDTATLDKAWSDRVQELQKPQVLAVHPGGVGPPPDAQRPDSWWTFNVRFARGE